jgi:DNA polymerase III, delta subunit
MPSARSEPKPVSFVLLLDDSSLVALKKVLALKNITQPTLINCPAPIIDEVNAHLVDKLTTVFASSPLNYPKQHVLEDIRQLLKSSQRKKSDVEVRAVLICSLDESSKEVQTTTLKFLEETSQVQIVVTTSNVHRLLKTVTSRLRVCDVRLDWTKIYSFFPKTEEDAEDMLRLKYPSADMLYAYYVMRINPKSHYGDTCKQFLSGTLAKKLNIIEEVTKSKRSLEFTEELLQLLSATLLHVSESSIPQAKAKQYTEFVEATLHAKAALQKRGHQKLHLTRLALAFH